MDPRLEAALRNRLLAAALAGVAGVVLLFGVALNERAVSIENLVNLSDVASYPVGAAALLAFTAGWLALRSANDVRAHGTAGPATLALLVVVIAILGGLLAAGAPAIFNAGNAACLAGGSRLMPGAAAVSVACGYQIPTSDFAPFYESGLAAAVAAVLGIASTVLLTRSRTPPSDSV
jgi:hypothetical protein